jgi:hypothetical protein
MKDQAYACIACDNFQISDLVSLPTCRRQPSDTPSRPAVRWPGIPLTPYTLPSPPVASRDFAFMAVFEPADEGG